MKKILVFGAGLVAAPLVKYLLEQKDFEVTVATRTVSKAEAMVKGTANGKAVAVDIDKESDIGALIEKCDLAISLLPYTYHVKLAKLCIKNKKHLVTTSYVSDEMQALDKESKDAGILLLNECGLDPGIDHMSAMKIIHQAQKNGGRIASFTSYCGGLPAPDANDNPFGYKFSWSPRGVLLAGTNPARYRMDGEDVNIAPKDLFASYRMVGVEGLGEFEGYPNRDSVPYKEIYGIQDADTVLRGTLRYPGWCSTIKALADIGFLGKEPVNLEDGDTYRHLTSKLVGGEGKETRNEVASFLKITEDSEILERMDWLGLFDRISLPDKESPLDMLCSLMEKKMAYSEGERDMIALQHNFIMEYPDRKEHVVSTLVEYGIPGGYSSMSRTVGLPAAMATKMILHGKISDTGVHIPVKPSIYDPILEELEKIGIKFVETVENI